MTTTQFYNQIRLSICFSFEPVRHNAIFFGRNRSLRCHDVLEFAAFNHVPHDIQSADEFTVHDDLRKRRPIIQDFQTLIGQGLVCCTGLQCNMQHEGSPCRTLSSVRMSKCVNSTFCSFSSATAFRENPQRGSGGEPFMNNTTLLWFMSLRSRAFNSSWVSSRSAGESPGTAVVVGGGAGAWKVLERGLMAETGPTCLAMLCVSVAASAPVILSRRVWPYNTALTSFGDIHDV